MLSEIQNRDDIFSNAINIDSVEERAAYIARACGDDAVLRRQVEERVAAHFQAASVPTPTNGALSNDHHHEHGGGNHAPQHADLPTVTHQAAHAEGKHPRGSVMTWALCLLLAAASVVSVSLAAWEIRAAKQAREEAKKALEERDEAKKTEEGLKKQVDQAQTLRQTVVKEREEARSAEEATRKVAQNTKRVLAFIQNNLLSAGHAMGWGGEKAKNLTLREAADSAEAKVAGAFVDHPLVEASVRYALGTTYLDLGEANLAVKQLERAYALREALLGSENSDTGNCRNKLAIAYRLAGRTDDASRLFEESPTSSSHASALAVGGALLLAQKKPAEAELKLRECLSIQQKIQPDDWSTFATKAMLGEALLQQKKFADAEPLLLSGYEGMKKREAKMPQQAKGHITKALERLVQLYEVWGKKDEAEKWRKTLERVEASNKIRQGSYLRILFTE